jgi:hypothetical protein
MGLCEIKIQLLNKYHNTNEIELVKEQIQLLNQDAKEILSHFKNLDPMERERLKKSLSHEHVTLIQSLLLLLL